jgi:hypothetical protein
MGIRHREWWLPCEEARPPLEQGPNDTEWEELPVKFTSTTAKAAIEGAGLAAIGVFAAATAAGAPPTIQQFGTSEQLVDGPMVTAYTVSNLQPANVTIPGYTPKGQLYQANITAQSNSGTVTLLISDFNARATNGGAVNVPAGAPPVGNATAGNGVTYHVIDGVAAPDGINPAPITQSNQSSGTIYFDVTGSPPNEVVYNDGVQDVLVWRSNA